MNKTLLASLAALSIITAPISADDVASSNTAPKKQSKGMSFSGGLLTLAGLCCQCEAIRRILVAKTSCSETITFSPHGYASLREYHYAFEDYLWALVNIAAATTFFSASTIVDREKSTPEACHPCPSEAAEDDNKTCNVQ